MSSDKKVAVITGGARGIGFSIAEKLANDGHIIVIADILADVAEKSANKLVSSGFESIAVTGDVSNPAEVDAMFKAITDKLGTVHILVNNAISYLYYKTKNSAVM